MSVNLIRVPFTALKRYYTSPSAYGISPTAIDPTDNPILFEFQTDIISVGSTPPFLGLNPGVGSTVNIPAGITIRLRDVTFTTSTNPFSPFEIPTASNTVESFDWASDFALKINNSSLGIDYTALVALNSFGNAVVFVRAKFVSPVYNWLTAGGNWEITGTTTLSGNPTNISGNSRGENLASYNYAVWLDLYKIDRPQELLTNQYAYLPGQNIPYTSKIASLSLPARKDNSYVFDLSNYLKSELDFKINITDYTTLPNYLNPFVAYYFIYGEQFSGEETSPYNIIPNDYVKKYRVSNIELRHCYSALINPYIENDPNFSDYWHSFNSAGDIVADSIKPLTNEPNGSLIRRSDDILLSWIYINDNRYTLTTNGAYSITYTYVDGTSTTSSNVAFSMVQSGMYCIKLNPLISNAESSAGKAVLYFEVSVGVIRSNSAAATPTRLFNRKYVLDTQVKESYIEVVWENEFNTLDKFSFEGIATEEIESSIDTFETSNNLRDGYIGDTSNTSVYLVDSTKKTSVSSGFVLEEQAKWLAGIERSLNAYIRTGDNQLKKINITKSELITNSDTTLYSVEVEYTEKVDTKSK